MAAVLICPNPGCQSESTGRFCKRCGSDLTMIACPSCGHRHPASLLDRDDSACDQCATPLSPRLLIVYPEALAPDASPGDALLEGRYRVVDRLGRGQFLAISLQPNLKPSESLRSATAEAYRLLARVPGVPALLDGHPLDADSEVLVLSAPCRGTELLATLQACWPHASRRARLSWLASWVALVEATAGSPWEPSALELDNLLAWPDGSVSLRVLLPRQGEIEVVSRLGELWLALLGDGEDPPSEPLAPAACALARQARSGRITLREMASEIDSWRRSPSVQVRHAGGTDVGRRRENNEDTFLTWHALITKQGPEGPQVQSRGMFAVCDGMGGHASGEVASLVAASALRQSVLALLEQEDPATGEFSNRLAQIVRDDVNSAIYALNGSEPQMTLKRMGTTLVGLVVAEDRAWHVHVGDSRLYRISRAGIEQLTDDHNIGTRDVKRGVATLLEAFRSPVGKHLTQALGPKSGEYVQPDVGDLALDHPCAFVLCSDGLSDMVPERDLERIVLEHWDDPASAVSELIREANSGGGHDNITAIVVRVDPAPPLFPEGARAAERAAEPAS